MRAHDPVRILRRAHYAYLTTLQIAGELGVRVSTAEAWLRSLESEGKVQHAANGWRAVYKGTEAARH